MLLDLIPLPYRILGALAIAGGLFAAGFAAAWHVKSLEEQAALAASAAHAVAITQAQDAVTEQAALAGAQHQADVQLLTTTLVAKVPDYVTLRTDQRLYVPVGLVRLLDAAAGGVPAVPLAAGQSDDQPSGLAVSALAASVVGNYGTCNAVRRQLIDLQAWIRAQQGVPR